MKTSQTSSATGTMMGAIGGIGTGYVLWLLVFSLVDDNAAVGDWAPTVLLVSVVLGVCAALWGALLRRRGKYLWSGFVFGLPMLPVVLTLAVLASAYF
jgi:hypothetical protein